MKSKQYSSYEEIDRDLEILKLERQLHSEKLKLSIENTKENLKLGNLVEGYLGFSSSTQKDSIISKIINFGLPFIQRWIERKFSKES